MIGDRIRGLRTSHRLSQTELSKLLHVSQQTITKWENGKAEPSSGALAKLAEYFDVSADYLLGSDKTSEPKSVDLEKDPVVLSYGGRPVSEEDMDIIKAILERHKNDGGVHYE